MVSEPAAVILKTNAYITGPASEGCPVKVPIAGLHQRRPRIAPVGRISSEGMQAGEGAVGSDFEDRADSMRNPASYGRHPVEVSVGGLDQPGIRLGPVRVAGKIVQDGQRAAGGKFVNRAAAATALLERGAVKVSVA